MANQTARGDSFYRTLVASGLLLALFALAWGRWNLTQSRDRLFVIEEQQVLAQKNFESQQDDAGRIDTYGAILRRYLSGTTDRNSPRFAFLTAEIERTDKRLRTVARELERKRRLANMVRRQEVLLSQQLETDAKRSDALAGLGFALTILGLFLWYMRRQRWLDRSLREDPRNDI